MLMQLIQSDPRFMDVFKELTGVDLMDMQEQQMKNKDTQEAQAKKRQADEAAKKAEEERLRKEAEEQALPDEERQVIQNKKDAEALKAQGNDFYKKKEFQKALDFYQQASDKVPSEITYYSNKTAVYFEMKDYEKCIATCDDAIKIAKEGPYDYVKLAKVMARKANALLQQGKFDESIEMYNSAMLENNDHGIKMGL